MPPDGTEGGVFLYPTRTAGGIPLHWPAVDPSNKVVLKTQKATSQTTDGFGRSGMKGSG